MFLFVLCILICFYAEETVADPVSKPLINKWNSQLPLLTNMIINSMLQMRLSTIKTVIVSKVTKPILYLLTE